MWPRSSRPRRTPSSSSACSASRTTRRSSPTSPTSTSSSTAPSSVPRREVRLFEALRTGARRTPPRSWRDGHGPRWRSSIATTRRCRGSRPPPATPVRRSSPTALDPMADVRATAVDEDARRLRVGYSAPSGRAALDLRLAGRFNVHNALAVVALGEALGLDAVAVRAGLEGVTGVPGRMERIDAGQPFGVIVDYAHSPASLPGVLDLLAPVAAARGGGLIAVFGSAGERDTAKRAAMGRIAGERCRLVVATDEDPRGEDRHAIIEEIVRGAEAAGRQRGVDVLAIADRRDGYRGRPRSGRAPATSCCWPARVTSRRSCTRTTRSRGTRRRSRARCSRRWAGAGLSRAGLPVHPPPRRRRDRVDGRHRPAAGRGRRHHLGGDGRRPPGRRHDRHGLQRSADGPPRAAGRPRPHPRDRRDVPGTADRLARSRARRGRGPRPHRRDGRRPPHRRRRRDRGWARGALAAITIAGGGDDVTATTTIPARTWNGWSPTRWSRCPAPRRRR